MLSVLRHKGVSKKILWVVAVVIILSFGVFGTAWRLENSINIAGKMYGHGVPMRNFEKAYLDSRDQAIMLYGDQFFKIANRLNLEEEAWDRLLLLHEARKRGIKTSDQEVVAFIASLPFFSPHGQFDRSMYQTIVESPQGFDRKVNDFEEGIRSQLTIKKLLDQAVGNPSISEDDLKKEYTLRNEKIKLAYALFDPLTAARDLTVTNSEIKQYYDNHKEAFRKPPMINVEYVLFTYSDKATEEQKQTAKKEATNLAKELKPEGRDEAWFDYAHHRLPRLYALAQKHQAQVTETGLFTQAQPMLTFAWSPELVKKIFSMKQGQYGQVTEMPDGWMVFRIKVHLESLIPPFDQAKDDARNALLMDKGFGLAKTKADSALKNIQEGLKQKKTFKELAKSTGAKVDETPLFDRGEYTANMGLIAEFQEATLTMNMQNRLSTVITTSQGPAIIYLESVQPIDEQEYQIDKDNFKDMMLAQRKSEAIVSFLTKLKFEANIISSVNINKK